MSEIQNGTQTVYDLDTLKPIANTNELTMGESILHRCIYHVIRTPQEELTKSFLTVVKEPSKARSVTKGPICFKIIMDLINRICSDVLKKSFPSSYSGMAMSDHPWRLFGSFFTEEFKDYLFQPENRSVEKNTSQGDIELITFRDLWAASTDYSAATDSFNLKIADLIGSFWMDICGIPKGLRRIARLVFQPRFVFFKALGPLRDIGEPFDGDVRKVRLVQGILMGDPLTKVILHLLNISVRTLQQSKTSSFFEAVFNAPQMCCVEFRNLQE